MKKITLLLALCFSAYVSGQANPDTAGSIPSQLEDGSTYGFTFTYDVTGHTSADVTGCNLFFQVYDTSTGNAVAPAIQFGAGWELTNYKNTIDANGVTGTHTWSTALGMNINPANASRPASSELPSGQAYRVRVNTNVGGTWYTSAWEDVELFATGTLSANKFNKSKLNAFYNSEKNALIMKEEFKGDFSIYNLLGQTALSGKLSNEISVENLKRGIYILSTEYGSLKFVK
ncbi:T9SS type A sorting domain-containing protein [Seonamhaeicola marinus]|uniref:T9SS type A sorting domain-containing protein n=1 Tax=Seonamhaeicola marinus TaxID=1912246 RepID=A0A5D0HN99_9FLAO|nr:T9SS type A sorting domain-containing protein [Seonamhaeicola marinus]TYA71839.1 T9SS type A sorting domain-containing protein [Seonamhaeicola marinus]